MKTKISFQIAALPAERFESLYTAGDNDLRARGARRLTADKNPGYPCRVSLIDAEPGETVLLTPFTHHDVASPYRASGPIFVRANVRTARPGVNEIPAMLQSRMLSVRAYDAAAMLIGAEVTDGSGLEVQIRHFFSDDRVEYLHLHNARPGCYVCRVARA